MKPCDRMYTQFAGVAELADAPDLGSGGSPCRFKSCHPYQKTASTFVGAVFLHDLNWF